MTEPDPLIALRQAIASRKPVTFLTGEQKPTTSFSDAAFLVLPQPSGAPVVNLSKSIPTRFRKPGQSQTDPTAHPADFYHLDAVYLAWSLREAATAEYMKSVRESGIGVSNMVAITEKQGIVEWLENKMDNHPNIVGLKGGASASNASPQKRRYVPDAADADIVKRIKQNEIDLRDRNTVLHGSKTTNFSFVHNLIMDRMQRQKDMGAASATPTPSSSSKSDPKSPSKRARQPNPIIMISSSPTALVTLWNVRKFLEESIFEDPVAAKTRGAEENNLGEDVVVLYRRRTHIEAGGRETETRTKYFVVDGIEALNKFGADAWDRVICVLTTGQAWQFKPYKWSEPRDLFHRVKGFYVSWTNDPPNPKVKDWNVTELKIDPNKRHLDKSTVAQFWKTLDAWVVGVGKPNLLV